jgi:hypothetical protein
MGPSAAARGGSGPHPGIFTFCQSGVLLGGETGCPAQSRGVAITSTPEDDHDERAIHDSCPWNDDHRA